MANVSFQTAGDTLYGYLAGEIDHASAQLLRVAIDTEIDRRLPQRVVLDFAGVGFMDSSGIGLILGRQRHLQAAGGNLCIRRAPVQIEKVLELAGIENMEEAKK
jgi:stage II sporulation protein AA (anti-sigma F factor antagonist)